VDNGRSVAYSYDALYRLTNAVTVGSTNYPKWGLGFTYDRYGNRTAQSISAGCVSPMVCPTNSVGIDTTTNRRSFCP
jgi:YD repeat-containing protein